MSKSNKSKQARRRESSDANDEPSSSQRKGSRNAGVSLSQGSRQGPTPSSSQMTDNGEDPPPSGSSQASKISPEELEKLTNNVIFYILANDYKKTGVRRQDISSNVMKNHGRCLNIVIEKARDVFSMIYGFKLVEDDKKRYFLVSEVVFPKEIEPPREPIRPQQSLLLIVLSFLFMMGRPIQEEHLYQFLEKPKILGNRVREEEEYFGDVKRLLTKDLVNMRYLVYKRRGDSDSGIFEFSMGERAKEEVPYRKLLEFVCKVNGANLNDYPAQLEEVKKQEETLHTELAAIQID